MQHLHLTLSGWEAANLRRMCDEVLLAFPNPDPDPNPNPNPTPTPHPHPNPNQVRRLRLWTAATSLGGVESLVEHRYSNPEHNPNTLTPYAEPYL